MSMRIQTFETVLIFTDKLTEEEYLDKVAEYKKKLAGLPAAKIKTELLGKKKLAYRARGCEYGWYVYFIYRSTEDLINSRLDLMLRRDDEVIKFLSTNYQEDYIPDDEQKKKPIDVFNLIFNIKEE